MMYGNKSAGSNSSRFQLDRHASSEQLRPANGIYNLNGIGKIGKRVNYLVLG